MMNSSQKPFAGPARALFGTQSTEYLNAITFDTTHAIANTGATSIFIMEGVDIINKRVASNPLTINYLTAGKSSQHTFAILQSRGCQRC